MSVVVKIGAQDWTLDPGPFQVAGLQVSGSMPGGYGAGSFEVPLANPYLAPHHSLAEGAWVQVFEDGTKLYEGEIFSIKPSVGSDGGKLSVALGGLISVAGKRADVAQTWVHRSAGSWTRRPGTPSSLGSVSTDGGYVDLRVAKGATEDYSAAGLSSSIEAVYVLDDGMSDGTISYVDLAGVYDVVIESTFAWTWALYTAPGLGGPFTITAVTATNGLSGSWTGHLESPELPAGTKALMLRLSCESGAHAVAAEKFLTLSVDVYSSGRTTKPRIDEALTDLATRTGLADPLTATAVAIGGGQDDLRIGGGRSLVSAAAGMATIAALHAQPVMYAFWDDRQFSIEPTPSVPANDARVIVVGGGGPGLDQWDVSELDEDVPDYCMVLFGNLDDPDLPEGYVRRMYAPGIPPDDADLRIETLDFSGLILADATAAALGANVTGSPSGGGIPDGAVWDAHPALADAGLSPGNNVDPTATLQDLVAAAAGTLTAFSYTTTSGWVGSGSPADPTCLVGDGVDDYVTFGDLSACDFGTAAFTYRQWVRLNAVVPVGSLFPIGGKLAGAQGWALYVDGGMHVVGYAGESAGNYRQQTGGTTLAVNRWYHVTMARDAAGEIALYVAGIAETTTPAGTVGTWDVSSAGELTMFKVG